MNAAERNSNSLMPDIVWKVLLSEDMLEKTAAVSVQLRKTICTHSPENWSFQLTLTNYWKQKEFLCNQSIQTNFK